VIKEGLHLFVEGQGPVEPYRGKYAVKRADVFALVREGWAQTGLDPASVYLPMRIEMELTTKCNDSCPSCGMGALPLTEGRTLSDGQIDFLLTQFTSIGVPSLAITGGEPFSAWRALLRVLKGARQRRIDISKLTTNGAWGTAGRCGPVFDRLEKAGFPGLALVRTAADAVHRRADHTAGVCGSNPASRGDPLQRARAERGHLLTCRPSHPRAQG
jgi:hypothetical protein